MAPNIDKSCPICQSQAIENTNGKLGDYYSLSCPRCGNYRITGSAVAVLDGKHLTQQQVANASGWVRDHQGVSISTTDLDTLLEAKSPTVHERAMKILQEIERRYPIVGQTFDFNFSGPLGDPSWLAVSWSATGVEVAYLVVSYLRDELGAVAGQSSNTVRAGPQGDSILQAQITPRGYALLAQLKEGNPESHIGFCAMWFDRSVAPLWHEAIEPAIRRAGYEPKRIDQHEHVNRIDEEIVAMIRRSRFVVADFTGQRGGVYFEAGFALALGLRVIWTCRHDELENGIHFDTRQYNFLAWRDGEWADISERLKTRIEATLGRGPFPA